MKSTVTDTMTVDLTKESIKDVTDDNTVNYVRKIVRVHDKKHDNKRIMLGKKDKLDVEAGDYVYILTEKEFKRLNENNEVCEDKRWWKRIFQR